MSGTVTYKARTHLFAVWLKSLQGPHKVDQQYEYRLAESEGGFKKKPLTGKNTKARLTTDGLGPSKVNDGLP